MEILLFVNDNILIKESIENYLDSVGFKVDSCLDGLEALDKFNKNTYDLILMDNNLPSMSGYNLVRSIREKDLRIPILVFCSVEYDKEKLTPHVQGIFDQNIDEEELAEKIREEINKNKKLS